ncbi:MAG: hypothetical protein ABI783_11615 [Actinomycetota bacterium]
MLSFKRSPDTVDDVRGEILRVVARQKRGGPNDLSGFGDEIDTLLAAISEFRPEWAASPCVYRVARLETDRGIVPFEDTVLLPEVKHTYELAIEMLAHIRTQKDLPLVKMPLFLHPDEIALALRPVQPEQLSTITLSLPEKELVPISPRRQRRLIRRQDWSETRRATLDRDSWECRQCGALKDLHLHRVDETHDEHDPASYVSLCRRCLPPRTTTMGYRSTAAHALEPEDVRQIRSQLALIFQKGTIEWVGFVLGKEYTVLEG